jgi:phosphatidylinositol alpha-mannosyltransferase
LLRAWPDLHRRTRARLRVVGADPLAVRYLLSRERIPTDGIDLLGTLSVTDLDRELRRAKLLVAPSLGCESFGMVLTRAFAVATPVVASDIDGYRRLISDRCGTLVPPGDEQRLAWAIVSLLENEAGRRRYAAAARELAATRYDWSSITAHLSKLYGELLEAPAARPVAKVYHGMDYFQ